MAFLDGHLTILITATNRRNSALWLVFFARGKHTQCSTPAFAERNTFRWREGRVLFPVSPPLSFFSEVTAESYCFELSHSIHLPWMLYISRVDLCGQIGCVHLIPHLLFAPYWYLPADELQEVLFLCLSLYWYHFKSCSNSSLSLLSSSNIWAVAVICHLAYVSWCFNVYFPVQN